jgi:hypothetical protein
MRKLTTAFILVVLGALTSPAAPTESRFPAILDAKF